MEPSPRRILIAEDNVVMSDVLRFNLQRAGFDTQVALRGSLAIGLLETGRFHAILTDYQMPEKNGEEICRFARGQALHRDTPIFLISAKSYELDVARLRNEYRLHDVFAKPFSPREIVKAVESALERRGTLCEIDGSRVA